MTSVQSYQPAIPNFTQGLNSNQTSGLTGLPQSAPGAAASSAQSPTPYDYMSSMQPFMNGANASSQANGTSSGLPALLQTILNEVIIPVVQTLTSLIQQLLGQSTTSPEAPMNALASNSAAPGSAPGSAPGAASGTPEAAGTPGGAAAAPGNPSAGAPSASGSQNSQSPSKPEKSEQTKNADGSFFEFRPYSEKDKNVAILLPKSLKDKSAKVEILSPDHKTVLSKGKFAGIEKTSGREIFRFDKQGVDYPDGAIVKITLQDGSEKTVRVRETNDSLKRHLHS